VTRHPIIDRYVSAMAEAHDITERFHEAFGRPPTREECVIAATLYIETNKQAGKIVRAAEHEENPDIPNACPKCGGEMWDNRTDKKSARSPDFKCKDKDCDHAIWLTPPPGKQNTEQPPPQKPISDPDDNRGLPPLPF